MQSASPAPSSRHPIRTDLQSPEVTMQSPLFQAGWTLAVLLGLYGFYCYWEAGRAELAAAFRQRAGSRHPSGTPDSTRYRTRCLWALLGSGVLAGSSILSAL